MCCVSKEEFWLQIRERQFPLDMKNLYRLHYLADGWLPHPYMTTMGTPASQGLERSQVAIGQEALERYSCSWSQRLNQIISKSPFLG